MLIRAKDRIRGGCNCNIGFVGLSYRVALSPPLHQTITELIAKALLLKKTLHFLSEKRLGLPFRSGDLFVVVPAGYVFGEMAVEAFTEITDSIPIDLIQLALDIKPSLSYALSPKALLYPAGATLAILLSSFAAVDDSQGSSF